MGVTHQIIKVDGEHIAVLHDLGQRRSLTFQNILIDEQYVAVALGEETDVDEVYGNTSPLFGSDTTYQEALIFFAPAAIATQVKQHVDQAVQELIHGQRELGSFEESHCTVAFKTTQSGLWVFVGNDSPGCDRFLNSMDDILDSFNPVLAYDWEFDENPPCNNMTCYGTATQPESGGSDFVNGLAREGNPIVALMQSEGLIDADVEFVHWNESD